MPGETAPRVGVRLLTGDVPRPADPKDEGKIAKLEEIHATGTEVAPTPREDKTVVFVAYLDAGLRLPCVVTLYQVLQLYGVDLA